MTAWQTYEEVAQHLLNELASHFKLGNVEGKQVVPGSSGTEWEIDAKAVLADGSGFLVVECRRHTKAGVSQEQIAGLAFRIQDTDAKGGIVVSPLKIQSGAKTVAAHVGVHHMCLDQKSTTTDYIFTLLNQTFLGRSDTAQVKMMTEHLTIVESDPPW